MNSRQFLTAGIILLNASSQSGCFPARNSLQNYEVPSQQHYQSSVLAKRLARYVIEIQHEFRAEVFYSGGGAFQYIDGITGKVVPPQELPWMEEKVDILFGDTIYGSNRVVARTIDTSRIPPHYIYYEYSHHLVQLISDEFIAAIEARVYPNENGTRYYNDPKNLLIIKFLESNGTFLEKLRLLNIEGILKPVRPLFTNLEDNLKPDERSTFFRDDEIDGLVDSSNLPENPQQPYLSVLERIIGLYETETMGLRGSSLRH